MSGKGEDLCPAEGSCLQGGYPRAWHPKEKISNHMAQKKILAFPTTVEETDLPPGIQRLPEEELEAGGGEVPQQQQVTSSETNLPPGNQRLREEELGAGGGEVSSVTPLEETFLSAPTSPLDTEGGEGEPHQKASSPGGLTTVDEPGTLRQERPGDHWSKDSWSSSSRCEGASSDQLSDSLGVQRTRKDNIGYQANWGLGTVHPRGVAENPGAGASSSAPEL